MLQGPQLHFVTRLLEQRCAQGSKRCGCSRTRVRAKSFLLHGAAWLGLGLACVVVDLTMERLELGPADVISPNRTQLSRNWNNATAVGSSVVELQYDGEYNANPCWSCMTDTRIIMIITRMIITGS